MNEEWEPWLVQDKDKRECWRRKASGHVHGLKDQSKYKTKKPKKQNFEETFWFSLKKYFFYFHFVFLVLKCKSRKNIAFFVFLKVYGWRKSPKTKKTQSTHKTKNQKTKTLKRLFGLASKHVFLVFILFFFGFEMQKQKKHCVFLFFWRFMVGENHQKPKKHKANTKPKTKKPKLWRDFLV